MIEPLKTLFMETLTAPAQAARQVLALQIPGSETWMALVLAACLNAMLAFALVMLGASQDTMSVIGVIMPVPFAITLFIVFTGTAGIIFGAGRVLQGAAAFQDILKLFTWLQFMRAAMMGAGVVVGLLSPFLSSLLLFFGSLYGFWILLNFINEAEGFDSFGKSLGVLGLSFIGAMVAVSILLSFVGITN